MPPAGLAGKVPLVNNKKLLNNLSSAGSNKRKMRNLMPLSTTGISAGTNKRKMRNLMPPAGLAGPVPLVYIYIYVLILVITILKIIIILVLY